MYFWVPQLNCNLIILHCRGMCKNVLFVSIFLIKIVNFTRIVLATFTIKLSHPHYECLQNIAPGDPGVPMVRNPLSTDFETFIFIFSTQLSKSCLKSDSFARLNVAYNRLLSMFRYRKRHYNNLSCTQTEKKH